MVKNTKVEFHGGDCQNNRVKGGFLVYHEKVISYATHFLILKLPTTKDVLVSHTYYDNIKWYTKDLKLDMNSKRYLF